MSQVRIAPLPLEDFRAVQRSLGQDIPGPPLNVLATIARNPGLYDAWLRFGGAVNGDALPARERELIILRTALRCGSEYEWAQHAGFARTAGLSDAEIRQVAAAGEGWERWEASEALLLRAVDELVDSHRVADDTWSALALRYPEAVLLQIFMLAGHYVMLAGLLNSVGVVVESEGMGRSARPRRIDVCRTVDPSAQRRIECPVLPAGIDRGLGMAFPQRQAAIVGVYTTKQGRKLTQSSFELEMEAIKGAIADAGLEMSDIDGVIPMNATPHVGRVSAHQFWAEQLGERPLTLLEIGLTSGAVAKAAVAIAAGMAEVVVLFWGKSGWELGPGGTPVPDRAPRTDPWSFEIFGGGYAHMYALWAQRYMHEFGVTNDQLAQVAVTHRYHATLNPDSVMGERGEITVDDVVGSRMVASPLHLLDCALDTDGGYAIVIASKVVAEGTRKKPVWILGGAEAAYTDFYMTIDDPWFKQEGQAVRKTGDLAFAMAGVTRDDIDTAGLYDCFTVTMLRDLEELGFCKLGEGADYFAEGHTRVGGKMPCNTDGGLLSNSHCGHPAGLHTIEVVRQLRGEAGERQIPDPKIGLSLAQGVSVHGQAGTLIMAVD